MTMVSPKKNKGETKPILENQDWRSNRWFAFSVLPNRTASINGAVVVICFCSFLGRSAEGEPPRQFENMSRSIFLGRVLDNHLSCIFSHGLAGYWILPLRVMLVVNNFLSTFCGKGFAGRGEEHKLIDAIFSFQMRFSCCLCPWQSEHGIWQTQFVVTWWPKKNQTPMKWRRFVLLLQ